MSSVQLYLSESLKEFVDTQAAARGYPSASDYIEALLREAQKKEAWKKVEALVLEGLQTPVREMSASDWEQLRRKIETTPSNNDDYPT